METNLRQNRASSSPSLASGSPGIRVNSEPEARGPRRSDVPFSLGVVVTLLKGWRSLWGGLGGRCTVSSQGPSSRGSPPPIQEAVRCKLAQVWELTEGLDWGAGRNGDRDTGTSEVMGTALLWTVRVGSQLCVCV